MPPPSDATVADRPPYRAAVAVFAVVLAGYIVTLAPTVTFWDAGEFIATAKILGIPHPPGTPLFVILAHVWAQFVAIGAFAYRTNLLTATISAAGTALFFLLVAQALRRPATHGEPRDPIFWIGGAAVAALVSAFAFTVWQTSIDTSKPTYIIATTSAAAICWLAWAWRKYRGTPRAPHLLLLVMYILSVSLGNHLMSLLVGPALIGFMAREMHQHPLNDERERRVEHAQLAVVAGTWALLLGTGMGNPKLLVLGALVFLVGAVYAAVNGAMVFAISVLGLACVGASMYLYLYLRANVHPFINEADPSNWRALWAVIRREQFPPRSPLDNPIYPSGPENPGRTLGILALQVQNYLQYFDWQWANGLAAMQPVFAWQRLPFTLLFLSLGIYGMGVLRERDRGVFWLLLVLWLMTGLLLMIYLNFKPGFSLAWNQYPDQNMHEVRERDYFFTMSYQVWGVFAGIGIAGLYRRVRHVLSAPWPAMAAVLGLGLVPCALNFTAASRNHGPDARLARDFAYDLLQSAEPYGIIFTNGDNDTFPLWYLQEVEEIRRDVSVVNLSLGNTDWYIRQLRDNPVRPFVPDQAPWFADLAPAQPPPRLLSWTNQEIESLEPQLLPRSLHFVAGLVDQTYEANHPFYIKDVLILRLIQENLHRRPIYFSLTAGSGSWLGMQRYMTQQGLVMRLHAVTPPDSTRLAPGLLGVQVDVPRSDSLAWDVFRYDRLLQADSLQLEPTSRNIATNLSIPFLSLGQAYQMEGQRERALKNLRAAYILAPSPELARVISAMGQPPDTSLPASDTAASRRR